MRISGRIIEQTSVDDLTERISIVYHEAGRNDRGDILEGEEAVRCMIWAKILPLTGKINDATPERTNTVTYRTTIRYRDDIEPDDKILWRGRRFRITSPPIDVESRHIWILFDCEEVVDDGKK